MREDGWIGTLRTVLIIAAIVAAALLIVCGDEIIIWVSENMFAENHSQLQELLK